MSIQTRLGFIKLGWMPLLLVACSGNTTVGEEIPNVTPLMVALNQRLFASPSMTSLGGGCTTYQLRSGASNESSGGGGVGGLPFEVSQKGVDDTVVVEVTDEGQQIVEKVYDKDFFQSGQRDDFTATSSDVTMLLRFWATEDSDGRPQCAPLSDDGSQTPLR